jgi:hypothetical protein
LTRSHTLVACLVMLPASPAQNTHARLTLPLCVASLASSLVAALSWAAGSTPWFSIVGGFVGPTASGAQDVAAFYYLDKVCASGLASLPLVCAEFSAGQASQGVSQSFSSRLVASATFCTIAGLCAVISMVATLAHGNRGALPSFISTRALRTGAFAAAALAVAFSVAGAALAMVTFSTAEKLAGFVPSRIDGVRNGGRWGPGLALGLSAAVFSLVNAALVVAVTHEKSPARAPPPVPPFQRSPVSGAEWTGFRKYGGHAATDATKVITVADPPSFSPVGRGLK